MLFKTNITNSIKSLKDNIQSKSDKDFKELFVQESIATLKGEVYGK